jgi:microcystin-dependent protein
MSNCSNCYNGCTEIVSDRCVKYTGIDVPVLGIQTGDSLSFVEQALITFLVSTLDGTGIKIDLDPVVVCNVVNKYLPTCKDLTIVDISKALIQAACDLQEQVDAIVAELAVLNANYTIGCLTGVTASSDTHAIVQAVITKLCQLEVDLIALALDVHTNYVTKTEIDSYIAAYINGATALVSAKMIPYVAVPFFPTPAFLSGKFDGTGAGIGTWAKIYLCNGANPGVPDLRGRVLVGATSGMNGGALNPAVDPTVPGNPSYLLGTLTGANQVTLLPTQIPSHTHSATAVSTVTDPKHKHDYTTPNANGSATGAADSHPDGPLVTRQTSESATGITVATAVTNAPTGGDLAHPNFQPAIGCYYIIYIP